MRFVLDTNIIISYILNKHGHPAQIREAWKLKKVEIATSTQILEEVTRVLAYPRIQKRHQWSKERITKFIKKFRTKALVTKGKLKVSTVKADPDDDKFLACAIEAKADAVVSGDPHLLTLKKYKTIPIITPREAVKQLKQSSIL